MYFTSGSDRAFEQLMQTRPGADHFDNGEAGAPEDCGTCRFYRPHWKYQFCVYEECPYQPGKLTALDGAVKFQVKGVDDEMAVFRVEKNRGYTVMSNHHLRNKDLSLKAKGLLSQMLSLPESWDFTLKGLSLINREQIDAIRAAVRELEQAGYIVRSRERDSQGRLRGADYIIYEQPQPVPDSPTLENPTLDTTVCQCEWADFPMEVLKKHWPQVPKFRDITTVTKEAFFEKTGRETTTLISGGFPCQPFSSAGKQRGFEDERYLWPEMLRVIRELHPSWVLGENVAGFIHLGLDKTVFDLEQAGYAVRVFVLPAVAVGAWHERKRTFIIGHAASHAPCQRHGGCGENCRCADDPDWELPKIQSQRNRMDGAAVMGGLQTAGQPAGGCETESRLGGMADGIPPEMDGHSMWAKEPAQIPYLISDPPANVAKRLKTLGNAVVPPQVYPILRYIAEIETGRCRNRQQGGDRIWNP